MLPFCLTVTQRAASYKQPRGGFLDPKSFEVIELKGGNISDLLPNENISPSLMGTTVDYATRVETGGNLLEIFDPARRGAIIVGEIKAYEALLSKVSKGLNDDSIIAISKLVGLESAFRGGPRAYKPIEDINPDKDTIENVRTMTNRSLNFLNEYGPKTRDTLTFENDGYTNIVAKGDGDFLTKDTLWDFKVSKKSPTSDHTLQIMMYWRMGLRSVYKEEYEEIKYLGIYNPRLNKVYRRDVASIPKQTIEIVDKEVIGYK